MIERGAKTADSTQDLRESWESVNAFGPNDSMVFGRQARNSLFADGHSLSNGRPHWDGILYLHVSDRNGGQAVQRAEPGANQNLPDRTQTPPTCDRPHAQ